MVLKSSNIQEAKQSRTCLSRTQAEVRIRELYQLPSLASRNLLEPLSIPPVQGLATG